MLLAAEASYLNFKTSQRRWNVNWKTTFSCFALRRLCFIFCPSLDSTFSFRNTSRINSKWRLITQTLYQELLGFLWWALAFWSPESCPSRCKYQQDMLPCRLHSPLLQQQSEWWFSRWSVAQWTTLRDLKLATMAGKFNSFVRSTKFLKLYMIVLDLEAQNSLSHLAEA